jgi:hypothetical protein
MYNIFEQPWLLLMVAFLLVVVVYVMRTSFPQKQKWWHLLIPVVIAVAAFGVDYLVATDHEKVKGTIENAITATVDADAAAMAPLIAADYRDRHHPSKKAIMSTFNYVVKRYSIKSITMTYHDIVVAEEAENEAEAEILVRVRMSASGTSMPTPDFAYAKLKLKFIKKPDGSWAIKSTDLVEVNKNSVSWKTY